MNQLRKIFVPMCLCGIFTVSGIANADPIFDVGRAYHLTELSKAFSLIKLLGARWESKAQYMPAPVVGRNKYGYPVPDSVKTAHEEVRKSALLLIEEMRRRK